MSDHNIGIAGLAIGIPGLVQTCLQLAQVANEKYIAFKQTGENTKNDFDLLLDYFDGLKTGLLLIEKLDPILDTATRERFHLILQSLRNLLFRAVEMLLRYKPQSLAPTAIGQRLAYVLFDARALSQLKADIAGWDKRWVEKLNLISHLSIADRLENLQRGLDLDDKLHIPSLRIAPSDGLVGAITAPRSRHTTVGSSNILFHTDAPDFRIIEAYRIPLLSTTTTAQSTDGHDETISEALEKDIQTLAARLNSADPERMSILKCIGCRPLQQTTSLERCFELDFEVPPSLLSSSPTTLRELLTASENRDGVKHPLNDRLELANRLATAVWFVHSGDFVHKSIVAENVLIFERQDIGTDNSAEEPPPPQKYPFRIGWSYLAGFESFRHMDTVSQKRGDEELSWNIYRRPGRWGNRPSSSFSLQDDIYSLGVVLWEIGLWTSLVVRGSDGAPKIYHKSLRKLAEAVWMQKEPQLVEAAALEVKRWLVAWAIKYIPAVMGNEYANVVRACLNSVEDVRQGYGGRSPATGSTTYMELVLEPLQRIVL